MSNVVFLASRRVPTHLDIPTPVNYQVGDVYYLIEFEEGDELPVSLFLESKLLVRGGERRSGMLHALKTPNGTALARLRFLNAERAMCMPLMEGGPTGEMGVNDLDIIGWVDEIYPEGWDGPRIVTLLDGTASIPLTHPLYVTSSSL